MNAVQAIRFTRFYELRIRIRMNELFDGLKRMSYGTNAILAVHLFGIGFLNFWLNWIDVGFLQLCVFN